MMKKNSLFILVLLAFSFGNAQTLEQQIIPVENLKGLCVEGAYYKDVHNLLTPYVGTWLYTNGNTSLKFVLKKIVGFDSGYCKRDLIVGEYEYIENGVTKINTLPNINVEIPGKVNHEISGESFSNRYIPPQCPECAPNELRLDMILGDPLKDVAFSMKARRTVIDGHSALSFYMYSDGIRYWGDFDHSQSAAVGTTMPNGNYVLMKQ